MQSKNELQADIDSVNKSREKTKSSVSTCIKRCVCVSEPDISSYSFQGAPSMSQLIRHQCLTAGHDPVQKKKKKPYYTCHSLLKVSQHEYDLTALRSFEKELLKSACAYGKIDIRSGEQTQAEQNQAFAHCKSFTVAKLYKYINKRLYKDRYK